MIYQILIFVVAITLLLISANFFTKAAEKIGKWLKLSPFVIGVFIVGIGTSLPELVSGILSVINNTSEILPGNIMGSNISNILLVTGFAVAINRKTIVLQSAYIYVDLHFLLGAFTVFYILAYDGVIEFIEASIGLLIFVIYAFYLIKGGAEEKHLDTDSKKEIKKFPVVQMLILIIAAVGIYFGADYTVSSLSEIAIELNVPASVVALTALSLGTTLPELTVNINAIRQGKAEMAIGNVLGSCIFNTLIIPGAAAMFGSISVPDNLISFALPVMAASGILFYLLAQDKKISAWEGLLFVAIYILFILKTAGF